MGNFFQLETYHDLFLKCQYDLKLLAENKYENFGYNLFNLVCTLNHLFDWFLMDDVDENIKVKCIIKFNPYDIEEIEKKKKKKKENFNTIDALYFKTNYNVLFNTNQFLVRKLCNKAKHFKRLPLLNTEREYTSTLNGFSLGQSSLGSFKNDSYYVNHQNFDYNIEIIVDELMNEWKSFLSENNLSCGFSASVPQIS